MSGNANYIPGH